MDKFDIAIIGAGVVGLAVAHRLSRTCDNIVVIERNSSFGQETSSRNSEVIHSGLYYKPGSLKAKTCVRGRQLVYDFCSRHGVPHKKTGKVVLAPDSRDIASIENIYNNARACGVDDLVYVSAKDLKRMEPPVSAAYAFYSPSTGIIDSHVFMDVLYKLARAGGVTFSFATRLIRSGKIEGGYELTVEEPRGDLFSFRAAKVINCAGLCAHHVAQTAGIDIDACGYRLHYCKGQYFRVINPGRFGISRLVYPPATKTDLGIHLTPDLAGGIRVGPDAVYVSDCDYRVDLRARDDFHSSVVRFLPSLRRDDLIPDTAGIRPKLQAPGEDSKDFVIREEGRLGFAGWVNLIGIESPGLTASLAIAEEVEKFFS